MQITVIVDRIWCCRLQLTLVLARPMCRNLTSCGIPERHVGVHEFGITFLVGTQLIHVAILKPECITQAILDPPCAIGLCLPDNKFWESRPGFEPGSLGPSPTLYGLS